jgi:hypothetical protein
MNREGFRMDFDFSFEQQLIGQSVRAALEELPPIMNGAPFAYPAKELTAKLANLGLFPSADAEERPFGFTDAVAIGIEVGRQLPAGPAMEQIAASLWLWPARRDLCAAMGEGQTVSVAVSGAFERHNGKLGGRSLVPFASEAQAILAPVNVGGGRQWLALQPSDLTLSRAETTDITVDASWAELTGPGMEAMPLPDQPVTLDEVLALLAMAEMVGAADFAMQMTVNYVRERKQFGKPIGTNQAVKHMAADVASSLEIMKAAIEYAGWSLDQMSQDASTTDQARMALLTARSFVGEHARLVLERCIQMHGGIAFTWDYGLHRYLRRILYRTGTLVRTIDSREAIAAAMLP